MFSVIIPTIWAPGVDNVFVLLEKISKCDFISEVLLINNAPDICADVKIEKVIELKFNNIYVNPAWNIGVKKCKSGFICIMNDDIDFNLNIFDFVKEQLKKQEVKIIGVSKLSYSRNKDEDWTIEKMSIRNRGWGCLFFLKKENYFEIPDDLKIHFGDDYLIKKLEGYVWRIEGLKIESKISTSVDSSDIIKKIIEQDNLNSLKYELPWSSDY